MKRLFVLGIAIMALGSSVFAASNAVLEKLNNETTQNAMTRYLNADVQQNADLQYIFAQSTKKYDNAIAKGASNEEASKKAINFNLANAKAILSAEQYRKYLTVLNVTFNNEKSIALLAEK